MKTMYLIEVSNRKTGKVYERKNYSQYGRISNFCNKMFAKYGEEVYCQIFKNMNFDKPIEEWRA